MTSTFRKSSELQDRLDKIILQNKEDVDSLNEEIESLKEQNQLLHDEIESLVETAEMKDEKVEEESHEDDTQDYEGIHEESKDAIVEPVVPVNEPEIIDTDENKGEESEDTEGAAQDENSNIPEDYPEDDEGPDDEDYDADEGGQIDSETGEIIESDNAYDTNVYQSEAEDEHLPEDESEDYNQGGTYDEDDHDKEDVVEENFESEPINDNDQSNDENYQLAGYEPDSPDSSEFTVKCH